jgi:hypothetical protein
MSEQTQFRGASLFVVGCGAVLSLFDWIFAMSGGSPNIVAPFGLFGFVTVIGGLIAFWRTRPAENSAHHAEE